MSCVRTGGRLQDVWCRVQVQAPLKTSSAPLITLTAGLHQCFALSPCVQLTPVFTQAAIHQHTHSHIRSQGGGESELLIWKAGHRPRQTSARTVSASEALIPWRRFFCTLPLISALSARCVTNLSGYGGWGYTSADLTGPTVWPCVDILQHCGGRDGRKS